MRRILLLLLILAALAHTPSALAAPIEPQALDLGGFVVDGPFLNFFQAHGGQAVLGYPLSDALNDPADNLLVQYFSLARLELHGDTVMLARLGSLRAAGREQEPAFRWIGPASARPAGSTYLPEAGHSLGGAFAWYHASHGGVEMLGLPISEEFREPQPDGSEVLVQYFERAILSYHPGSDRDDEVRQAALGAWMAEQRLSPLQRSPGRPLLALASVALNYNPASASGHNIELAASRLDRTTIEPGQIISFLSEIGEVSQKAGYVAASGIVGGQVRDDVIGGGICSISTLLLRAGWAAGLPIVERRAHRYLLHAFADAPGLDAAVFTPSQDLRLRNDSGSRLYLRVVATGGQARLTIWGRGDGRTTEVARPVWVGESGLEVVNTRVVEWPGGAKQTERLVTRYEPQPAPPTEPAEPTTAPADAPDKGPH